MYSFFNNCVQLDLSYDKIILSSNYSVNTCIVFLYILGTERTRGEMEEHHILMKKNQLVQRKNPNESNRINQSKFNLVSGYLKYSKLFVITFVRNYFRFCQQQKN
jgi:hypothetical protein